jgi:hypothetical protein
MKLFNKKQKPQSKRVPKTLKQILSDSLIREVNKDPELKRELALRESGYGDVIKDKSTKQRDEIKSKVTDMALKRIDEDPELAERFTEAEIESIIYGEKSGHRKRYDSDNYVGDGGSGSAIGDALAEIENFELLKEKLGGKGGALGGLINSDVIIEALKLFASRNSQQAPTQRTFVVQIDGQAKEVDEDKYRELVTQNRIKPVAILTERTSTKSIETEKKIEEHRVSIEDVPETKPKNLETKQVELKIPEVKTLDKVSGTSSYTLQIDSEPELPEFIQKIKFNEVISYLDRPPEDFIKDLKSGRDNVTINMIWTFLQGAEYDQLVQFLNPYKSHSKIGIYVTKLLGESNKEWLETVLNLIRKDVE